MINIPISADRSDAFYVEVVRTALREGMLREEDKILVVCGGAKDEVSLREAGVKNFVMSNIGGEEIVDVENLPYENGAFDAVLVHSGLHHCESPHRGLLEMHRVAQRTVVMFEPADNMITKLGQRFGIGQTYEFAAVADNKLACGGWRNTSVPNWVYRFTASEVRQTLQCAAPFGPHKFRFFYRTRIPWRQLRDRPNKLPLILATLAAPVLRMLDICGPFTSNNMAAVIVKPQLPEEMFPWVAENDGSLKANEEWFSKHFGISSQP